MKKKIKILCTLGPASMDKETVIKLDRLGVDIFRINLSHTELKYLEKSICQIKEWTDRPLCIDTEGAQVRVGRVKNNRIYLKEGSAIRIYNKEIIGDTGKISLNPAFIIKQISPGDLISIDFDSALLHVMECSRDSIITKVISGGYIASNRAVSIDRHIELPAISKKDRLAINIALKHGIRNFALSFANKRESVEELRNLVGNDACIISKIESKEAIRNLDGIIGLSDALLIDRGDLSRDEPIEKIPFIQKLVIKRAAIKKIPVYVATNLLESMVKNRKPTRAEANDVINTLMDGASGLVLAAETAIGSYPVNCVVMVSKMINEFLRFSDKVSLDDLQRKDFYFLVEPHGGALINRVNNNLNIRRMKKHKILAVDKTILMDAEQIALGAFSPLEGFMRKRDFISVLGDYRLSDGTVWPLPIVLQTTKEEASKLKVGDNVALSLKGTQDIFATLNIEDIYTYDLEKAAIQIFGTQDVAHPGVRFFMERGRYFIAGNIELIRRLPSAFKHLEITPRQARIIFENKGWSKIVGFHTRNVIHRVHEHLQIISLENYHCDGIFIHPVIGYKKRGDYTADIILKSIELLIEQFYPKGKVFLAAFQNYARYAGPREAVFTALCRKNFGCSHFIIGRDHTGVGNFYSPADAHKLFKKLPDIGITPIFYNEINYCKRCKRYVEQCMHNGKHSITISATVARKMLENKKAPPVWLMRESVSSLILEKIKNNEEVFVK